MSLENKIGFMIVALLIGDLLLMWRMIYGVYPWESGAAQ